MQFFRYLLYPSQLTRI